jgi:hypothetical protein
MPEHGRPEKQKPDGAGRCMPDRVIASTPKRASGPPNLGARVRGIAQTGTAPVDPLRVLARARRTQLTAPRSNVAASAAKRASDGRTGDCWFHVACLQPDGLVANSRPALLLARSRQAAIAARHLQ